MCAPWNGEFTASVTDNEAFTREGINSMANSILMRNIVSTVLRVGITLDQ